MSPCIRAPRLCAPRLRAPRSPFVARALRAVATALTLTTAIAAHASEVVPTMVLWPEPAADPRELSGVEIGADGREIWAVSDRGYLLHATISRTASGDIAAISQPTTYRLDAATVGGSSDAEGIAILPDGRLAISFENPHRVVIFNRNGSVSEQMPAPAFFGAFPGESGPEAVAATRDGSILVAMEGIPRGAVRIPLYRHIGGQWGQIEGPSVDGRFQPVGLDTDDRGRVYLLERDYRRPASFASRLRRFTISGSGVVNVETLWQTAMGDYGNLEGVSIWRAADGGLRATLVADDQGMRMLQRGLTEFRLPN